MEQCFYQSSGFMFCLYSQGYTCKVSQHAGYVVHISAASFTLFHWSAVCVDKAQRSVANKSCEGACKLAHVDVNNSHTRGWIMTSMCDVLGPKPFIRHVTLSGDPSGRPETPHTEVINVHVSIILWAESIFCIFTSKIYSMHFGEKHWM